MHFKLAASTEQEITLFTNQVVHYLDVLTEYRQVQNFIMYDCPMH